MVHRLFDSKSRSNYFNEIKSKTASAIEVDATLGKALLPDEIGSQTSTRFTHQETSKKYPKFKHAHPTILLEYDIIVHLHWKLCSNVVGKSLETLIG